MLIIIDNLLKSLGGAATVYESGKRKLTIAIGEYDQAVCDLTARVVASMLFFLVFVLT